MAHRQILGLQRGIIGARRMDVEGKLRADDVLEAPILCQRDVGVPFCGRLGRVGARPGIEQRELFNTIRRLPDDLERDVAAHRKSRERKTRRRHTKDAPGNRRHGVVAGVIHDRHRSKAPQRRHLRRIEPRRAVQTRHKQDRHAFGHQRAPFRRLTTNY